MRAPHAGPAPMPLTLERERERESLPATGEGAKLDTRPWGGLLVLHTVRDRAAWTSHCKAVGPAPPPRERPSHGAPRTQAGRAGSGCAPAPGGQRACNVASRRPQTQARVCHPPTGSVVRGRARAGVAWLLPRADPKSSAGVQWFIWKVRSGGRVRVRWGAADRDGEQSGLLRVRPCLGFPVCRGTLGDPAREACGVAGEKRDPRRLR